MLWLPVVKIYYHTRGSNPIFPRHDVLFRDSFLEPNGLPAHLWTSVRGGPSNTQHTPTSKRRTSYTWGATITLKFSITCFQQLTNNRGHIHFHLSSICCVVLDGIWQRSY